MDHPISEDIAREQFQVGVGRFDGGTIWIAYANWDEFKGWVVVPKDHENLVYAVGFETFVETIMAIKRWRQVQVAEMN